MTEQQANIEICEILKHYFEENPDLRFCQGLFNLGINEFETTLDLDSGFDRTFLKDKYNEESSETLKIIQNNI